MVSPISYAEESMELDDLLHDIDRIRIEQAIPSVALTLVDKESVIWSGTFGLADRDTEKPADAKTLYRIGSITKMFTGIALMMAQEDGLLQLDDPARKLVPDLPVMNQWEDSHPIRVAHLLEHTAGLPDMSKEEFDHNIPMDLRDALSWKGGSRKTLWPPGLHSSYTNVGAGLAAYILQQVAHEKYEHFVEERIFVPLGMKSATFYKDAMTSKYLATGYDADGHTVIPYWHVLYRAFGGINVRPAEMAPFIQMLLNNGRYQDKQLLSEQDVHRIETPKTTLAAKSGLQFGYGLGNYTYLRKGILFHGHGGDGDGYLARLGYNRDRGMGYFLVINVFRNRDLTYLQHVVEDFIIDNLKKQEPPVAELPKTLIEQYTGKYRSVTSRFAGEHKPQEIIIARDNGGLVIRRNKQTTPLLPVNQQHFRYPGETMATAAFVQDEADNRYFQDDLGNYVQIQQPNFLPSHK